MGPGDFPSPSVKFLCGVSVNFCQLSVRPWTFRQLSLCPHNLPSTSVIFPCLCWTLRKLMSTFCASEESSIIFRASTGPSVNFCQTSLTLRDCPSTSVNFPCVHGICYQPSVRLWNLVSTFRASTELLSTFRACTGPSGDFRQHLCIRGTFCELSMRPQDFLCTFCACAGPWVDFRHLLCVRGTFSELSMRLWDLLSTFRVSAGPFICFPYGSGTFRQVPTTFRTSVGSFVNFR